MANIELVEQTFRDGQQNLWGMRLRGGTTGTLQRTYDYADETSLRELLDQLMTLERPRSVVVTRPEGRLELTRTGRG